MTKLLLRLSAGTLLSVLSFNLFAQESDSRIEEVVVTAQRTAESIQEVPIAVTALTGEMLEDRGVLTVSDIQMNSPSLSFTPTNFGGSSLSIRGIGNLVIGGESGVSTHINEIPVASNLNTIEFYDLERVEVLRGPQGTLFGRNATGGAVNFVTRRPDFDSVNGFIDYEYGDYENHRLKGAINLPITDTFALRFAGMKLDRDGYITNRAFGQVADNGVGAGVDTIDGIDKDLDGRDILSLRLTAEWAITDRANLWMMYSRFEEEDDRVRITNQICQTNEVPTTGCTPDGVALETPHAYTGTGGIIWGTSALAYTGGGAPGSAPQFASTVMQKYNRPDDLGIRDQHTDFEPVFEDEEDIFAFGFEYDFDSITFGFNGLYREGEYLAQQDYYMDTGALLYDGSIDFPTSRPAGGAGDDWRSGPCSFNDGTSGATAASNSIGGCAQPSDGTQYFVFDQADLHSEYWTIEAKAASSFDGPLNFLVGINAYETESYGDYYVLGNSLDVAGAYPGFFNNTDDPDQPTVSDGWAIFGEAYWDITDRLKFTLGLRYNEDHREDYGTSVLFNSYEFDAEGNKARTSLAPFLSFGAPLDEANTALAQLYGVTSEQIAAAELTAAGSPERVAVATTVPPVPQAAETRFLTGSPTEFDFDAVSGRIGLDYMLGDNAMLYGFFSRGYKPGGLNPAIPVDFQSSSAFSFDKEEIDAFEIGAKTTVLDGQMVINGAFYVYDYSGLQVSRIVNNSSINENIDADIMGLELETFWQPDFAPGLMIDFAYAWTDTEVVDATSIDPTNRTAGDPDWLTFNNTDGGANTGVNFVADTTSAGYDAAVLACGALPGVAALAYPDGTPALQSKTCLDTAGIGVSDGLATDISGNNLPNTPEHSIKLGAAYTWDINAISGALTLRWDYYWQDDSFGREFNTLGDQIDSWDQHNMSLIYESLNGQWQARLWVRNLEDEDNVTGHYLTSDTSGFYRNYFLTEPRIWGASVRWMFGN